MTDEAQRRCLTTFSKELLILTAIMYESTNQFCSTEILQAPSFLSYFINVLSELREQETCKQVGDISQASRARHVPMGRQLSHRTKRTISCSPDVFRVDKE